MTTAMPNFSPTGDAVIAAEGFFRRAADQCSAHGHRWPSERDRQFLIYLGRVTQLLSRALSDHQRTRSDGVLQTWVQYTPEEPVPAEPELSQLRDELSVPALVAHLQDAARRWAELHERLERTGRTSQAKEFHASCRALLITWSQRVSSALVQHQDI